MKIDDAYCPWKPKGGAGHVEEISLDEGIEIALTALYGDRLALFCGAGLSMAPPSLLPSAADLAREAKRRYQSIYGATRSPLPDSIEEQADCFFCRGELATVYLRTLIDPHHFAGHPNSGHYAVADLLLVQAIRTAVSTNVDTLVEIAGTMMFGKVGVGIDRRGVATLPPNTSPLLKIHGCWWLDPDNTVWAPSQLSAEPVASRVRECAEWLSSRLLDHDLIIVGYFTDWDYLNELLGSTLGAVRPSRVLIVDPGQGENLAVKAPSLYEIGGRATSRFCHVMVSGADFLERLRKDFSMSFVRRVFYSGQQAYEHVKGTPPDPAWLEPAGADVEDLWRIRRDLEGRLPNQPARERIPPEEPTLGLTLLQLRAGGAVPDGPYWLLGSCRVRVLRTSNQLLHLAEAAFAREVPPATAPDLTIAVGAEASVLPADLVRSRTAPTIARGAASRWLTREEAILELGL